MLEKYDRAKLLDEVWTDAVTVVAPRYQLSDVGLQKLCRRLQIPTPPRGYWTRLKAGKPVAPRPKLREYIGHPMHLFRTSAPPVPPTPLPLDERLAVLLAFERDPANHIVVPDHIRHWHPLVVAAQQSLKKPVIDQRDMPSTRRPALSISVSPAQQARALKIADVLLKAFEARGYPVTQGQHDVNICMLGRLYHLRLFEACTKAAYVPTAKQLADQAKGAWSYWPKSHYVPTGRLQVLINEGYAGKLMDSDRLPVEAQLNKLLEQMATTAVESLVNAERQAVIDAKRQQLREAALERKRLQDSERQRLGQLETDAHNWRRAQAIREYLDALEQTLDARGSVVDQQAFIQWGRAKAAWLEPLLHEVVDILDEEIKVPF